MKSSAPWAREGWAKSTRRDRRLDRTVAVKVLPEKIAQREDLRARFEREARTVASLQHPHSCSLFDIGPGYMVMELIEGESLAARIAKGALPLEQSLAFAIQIADALDRAHRAGRPRVRTELRVRSPGIGRNYDITPDGKRLAAMVADEEADKPPTHLTVLLNFFDELRRLAPAGK